MDAMTVKTPVQPAQCLSFHVAGEEYAIGILQVKEIIDYDTLTRVPKTPPWVRGVINLRGNVVPVVDLAVKFGLPETGISKRTCIVIVEVDIEGEAAVMGVMADAVSQVIDFQPGDIEPPPTFGTRVSTDYLLGMGRSGKKFVLILDIDKVLSAGELQAVADLQEDETQPGPSSDRDAETLVGADSESVTAGEPEANAADRGHAVGA